MSVVQFFAKCSMRLRISHFILKGLPDMKKIIRELRFSLERDVISLKDKSFTKLHYDHEPRISLVNVTRSDLFQ